jgi:hypothetical protein
MFGFTNVKVYVVVRSVSETADLHASHKSENQDLKVNQFIQNNSTLIDLKAIIST